MWLVVLATLWVGFEPANHANKDSNDYNLECQGLEHTPVRQELWGLPAKHSLAGFHFTNPLNLTTIQVTAPLWLILLAPVWVGFEPVSTSMGGTVDSPNDAKYRSPLYQSYIVADFYPGLLRSSPCGKV